MFSKDLYITYKLKLLTCKTDYTVKTSRLHEITENTRKRKHDINFLRISNKYSLILSGVKTEIWNIYIKISTQKNKNKIYQIAFTCDFT